MTLDIARSVSAIITAEEFGPRVQASVSALAAQLGRPPTGLELAARTRATILRDVAGELDEMAGEFDEQLGELDEEDPDPVWFAHFSRQIDRLNRLAAGIRVVAGVLEAGDRA